MQTPKTGSNAESASYKIEGRQEGNFDVISNLESKPTTAATMIQRNIVRWAPNPDIQPRSCSSQLCPTLSWLSTVRKNELIDENQKGKEENDESEKIWTMMTCRCNWPVGSPHPHYTVTTTTRSPHPHISRRPLWTPTLHLAANQQTDFILRLLIVSFLICFFFCMKTFLSFLMLLKPVLDHFIPISIFYSISMTPAMTDAKKHSAYVAMVKRTGFCFIKRAVLF